MQAPVSLQRKLNAQTMKRARRVEEQEITVFLGGPFIDPDSEEKSSGSAASILRFNLFHALRKQKHIISLGEYKELVEAYADELGGHKNAAIAEIDHAGNVADATVIIVDSPGSFAEIGAFSLNRKICSKMLILSDIQYRDSTGYIANGPFIMAKSLGAKLFYVNLSDIEGILGIINPFVKEIFYIRNMLDMVSN